MFHQTTMKYISYYVNNVTDHYHTPNLKISKHDDNFNIQHIKQSSRLPFTHPLSFTIRRAIMTSLWFEIYILIIGMLVLNKKCHWR